MKNIVRLLAPIALLVPGACSLIADADRSKITDDDSTAAQGGSAASGEGGSGDSPSRGGSSGKGGGGSTAMGGTGGKGGGSGTSGAGGEPESGGMGGVPESAGAGGEPDMGTGGSEAGSGGEPVGGAGGESGMGGGCELELCGVACVDTSLDTAHCGACERECSNVNTSALTCASGECAPACAAGYGDCNEDDGAGVDDGCETNFNDNATCGTSCANLVACEAGEFCVEGVCEPQCDAPNTECTDACVNLDTALAHCGTCDRACDVTNSSGTECAAGTCDPTCNAGFDDCNLDDGSGPDDGCETNIDTSAANCNACGRTCSTANASTSACDSGACVPSCDADFADCNVDTGSGVDDGCETDLEGDASHCNGCGRACSEAGASDTACFAGTCDPSCNPGFADCNVDDGTGPDDGCETNLDASASNCNDCGRICSTANASTSACTDGACAPTCQAGFGDCDADDGTGIDDGCETDLDSNASCGTTCGTRAVCTSGQTCIAGECTAVATGVVKVAVPLAAGGQGQRYNLLHQGNPALPVDLDGTNLVIRAYAPNAINGNLSVVFLGGAESAKTLVEFALMSAGFTDVVVPVPAAAAGFDPTAITVVRVEIETPEGDPGPWEQPATVVYFDSFTSANGNLNDTFDTDPLPALFDDSGARPLAGSSAKYLAAVP